MSSIMRVRSKLILVLISMALVPLATAGVIAYRTSREALRESLGASFQRMAAEGMDKVDRSLHEIYKDVQLWAGLELMQEVVTGDLDGKISSLLMAVDKEHEDFVSLDAMDLQGNIVASSEAQRIGRVLADDEIYQSMIAGRSLVRDIKKDEQTGNWVVLFCWPIRAQFDESETVGALCARWDAAELDNITRGLSLTAGQPAGSQVVLMREDGLTLSAPGSGSKPLFEANLIGAGWQAARLAGRGEDGYTVERRALRGSYLVGYSHSKGYRDFAGLRWSALVVQDLETAFAPVYQLELVILAVGVIAVLVVGGMSLVISHQVTVPLVKMADVAQRVAGGDFEGRVGYRSGDEIGTLAEVFDGMINDLESQRARLIDEIAERKKAAAELRHAKEAAEESTTTLAAVLNTMGEGIITLDPRGTIVMVNQEVLNIWGYSRTELLGQTVEKLMAPEYHDQHGEGFRRYLETSSPGSAGNRLQAEGLRKDGTSFPVEISVGTTNIGERPLVTAAVRDITERVRAEEQIRASLEEKEALLQEIHHRVKNNLQVIVSLLNLQSGYVKDAKDQTIFKDSESRVKSMALIHEKLYRSQNLSQINVADYIEALTKDLFSSYGLTPSRVTRTVNVESLALGIDTAIHCGLIVNELVSNALKYAFPGEREGEVRIELRKESGGEYLLVVKDDGIGLPEDLDLQHPKTLGLQLVSTLADQLEGKVEVDRSQGAEIKIVFKDLDAETSTRAPVSIA